jgi:hypothetical protein
MYYHFTNLLWVHSWLSTIYQRIYEVLGVEPSSKSFFFRFIVNVQGTIQQTRYQVHSWCTSTILPIFLSGYSWLSTILQMIYLLNAFMYYIEVLFIGRYN